MKRSNILWARVLGAAVAAVGCSKKGSTTSGGGSAATGPGTGTGTGTGTTATGVGGAGSTTTGSGFTTSTGSGSTTTSTGTGTSSTSSSSTGTSGGPISPTDMVTSGAKMQSLNFKLVNTLGQPTQNQSTQKSAGYRMQGGLVGAMGSLP